MFFACAHGQQRGSGSRCEEAYGVDEEAREYRVPETRLGLALLVLIGAINLLEVACKHYRMRRPSKKEAVGCAPATSEKLEPDGRDEGETSGKEMGRRRAVLSRILEKEWT